MLPPQFVRRAVRAARAMEDSVPFRRLNPVENAVHLLRPSLDDEMLSMAKPMEQQKTAGRLEEIVGLLSGPSGREAATLDRALDLFWRVAYGMPHEGRAQQCNVWVADIPGQTTEDGDDRDFFRVVQH